MMTRSRLVPGSPFTEVIDSLLPTMATSPTALNRAGCSSFSGAAKISSTRTPRPWSGSENSEPWAQNPVGEAMSIPSSG
jgi:hypothetical protein